MNNISYNENEDAEWGWFIPIDISINEKDPLKYTLNYPLYYPLNYHLNYPLNNYKKNVNVKINNNS